MFEFRTLLEMMKNGLVDEINIGVLRCLLDIDDTEFVATARRMDRDAAKDFLWYAAKNDPLAEVLQEEDDRFNILRQFLHEAVGSRDLIDILEDSIEDGMSFFWLAAKGSKSAWLWVDNYVSAECDKRDKDCPGEKNIGAYCKALLKYRKEDLGGFLSEADLFADAYQDEVENRGYEYVVREDRDNNYHGDFRDYCSAIVYGRSFNR